MKIINDTILDKVISFWRNGAEPPLNLGMGTLNDFYGLKMGTVTDITGYPYSGKTLFLKSILINSYLKHKVKHCLYLPDDGDTMEIVENLIHKLSGKTFNRSFDNQITENEVYKWTRTILNDFVIVSDEEKPTPLELWNKSVEMGCKTCSIDSWNVMSHKDTGTKYLADTLSERNRLAQANKVHFFTIIHPKNPTGINYDKDGKLKPPSQFDLMGGSEWNNNAKNILVVHKHNPEDVDYNIFIRKTKPRIVGRTGVTTISFHIPSQRFYQDGESGEKNFFYDNGFEIKKEILNLNDHVNINFGVNEAPF